MYTHKVSTKLLRHKGQEDKTDITQIVVCFYHILSIMFIHRSLCSARPCLQDIVLLSSTNGRSPTVPWVAILPFAYSLYSAWVSSHVLVKLYEHWHVSTHLCTLEPGDVRLLVMSWLPSKCTESHSRYSPLYETFNCASTSWGWYGSPQHSVTPSHRVITSKERVAIWAQGCRSSWDAYQC